MASPVRMPRRVPDPSRVATGTNTGILAPSTVPAVKIETAPEEIVSASDATTGGIAASQGQATEARAGKNETVPEDTVSSAATDTIY